MKYLIIQTNRAKIKEIISIFSKNAIDDDLLIVPRPMQKQTFNFYIGYARVNTDSDNDRLLSKLNKCRQISSEQFNEDIIEIKYSWTVEKIRSSS